MENPIVRNSPLNSAPNLDQQLRPALVEEYDSGHGLEHLEYYLDELSSGDFLPFTPLELDTS